MRFFTPALSFLFCINLALGQGGEEPSKQPAPDPSGAGIAAKKLELAKARLKKTGETSYELGDLKFDSAKREIRFPAVVNMTEGVLEYALVHENGKTHESLLRTTVSPTELNLVFLLCHFEPHIGEAAKFIDTPVATTKELMNLPMVKEGANRMVISVLWKDKDGSEQTTPVAHWFRNRKTSRPMEFDHWTYTGSLISDSGYAAEFDGSIIATYFDLVAMVNCPVKENSDDEVWYAETDALPPLDTPVTVVLSPFPAK